MTEEQKQKNLRYLVEHYYKPSREVNKHRRWDGDRVLTLAHIKATGQNTIVHTPKHLERGLVYFIKRYPQYSTDDVQDLTLTKRAVNTCMFFFRGDIAGGAQLGTYLLYILFNKDAQYILRDRPKERAKMFKHLQEFTYQHNNKPYKLFSEILKSGDRAYKRYKDVLTTTYQPK